uniref:(northern house mosquito) hypothetical protein n=1 Tax=Culex pipiens TaxID=7175 RepID=A0A8D8F6Z4_CULPI
MLHVIEACRMVANLRACHRQRMLLRRRRNTLLAGGRFVRRATGSGRSATAAVLLAVIPGRGRRRSLAGLALVPLLVAVLFLAAVTVAVRTTGTTRASRSRRRCRTVAVAGTVVVTTTSGNRATVRADVVVLDFVLGDFQLQRVGRGGGRGRGVSGEGRPGPGQPVFGDFDLEAGFGFAERREIQLVLGQFDLDGTGRGIRRRGTEQ